MKIACVVHRYGTDVTGGSEAHCRAIAERLAERHDVTVLTSCARDYVTWRNEYPPGTSMVGPVRVIRFPVTRTRRLNEFRHLSELVFGDRATETEQERWFVENGPLVPGLIDHLGGGGTAYDRVLFWSYRYYPSFFGVRAVPDKAILVPTAEDDPLIKAAILSRFFALPKAYLFLTPEEQQSVVAHLPEAPALSQTIGIGLDPARGAEAPDALHALGLPAAYVLYVGRIERNKGCETLLRYMTRYLAEEQHPVPLVMAGPAFMPIPDHPMIRPLGFVPDNVRDALFAHARALVVPSPYESLSIVLLEAWNRGIPALVNARCRVLKGQVERANGGLHYNDVREFCEGWRLLAHEPATAARLGRQGLAYVEREYRWPTVMAKIETLLNASM
jgi:glycosyltransferase involved in cell wall biosynthesis